MSTSNAIKKTLGVSKSLCQKDQQQIATKLF